MPPPPGYRPRNPRATALYQAVNDHRHAAFAPFTDTRLPAYVDRHLGAYLRCGVLDYGFLRVRCDACRQDLLVAFSCKKRGVCPSCSARRAPDGTALDFLYVGIGRRREVLADLQQDSSGFADLRKIFVARKGPPLCE